MRYSQIFLNEVSMRKPNSSCLNRLLFNAGEFIHILTYLNIKTSKIWPPNKGDCLKQGSFKSGLIVLRKLYVYAPRKCHNREAQPSQGTKRRWDVKKDLVSSFSFQLNMLNFLLAFNFIRILFVYLTIRIILGIVIGILSFRTLYRTKCLTTAWWGCTYAFAFYTRIRIVQTYYWLGGMFKHTNKWLAHANEIKL